MVVGGYPNSAFHDVELIDLSGQGRICAKPDDFLAAQYGSVGTYLTAIGQALVCGGYQGGPYTANCYTYIPDNRTWSLSHTMTIPRGFSAAGYIDGNWWITGGRSTGG